MKLRLLILLLAVAALAAAPAAGQTIKSLGYNTTNGFVTYSGSNSLTFTNALQFSTNARAATRTNLGGTTLGNAVFTATNTAAAQVAIFGTNAEINTSGGLVGLTLSTNETKLLNPISFPFLGGATAAATSRTNLALGAGDNVTFSNITANGIVNAKNATLGTATNAAAAQGIQWSGLGGAQHAAIYGAYDGVAEISLSVGTTSNALSDVATFRSTGMTVTSNAVVGGTLAVTGNVTMSGVGNTAPSQTASSASSLMTRQLSDDRYFNQPNLLHININNFTGATVGGNSSGRSTGLLNASGQTVAATITNSFLKMGDYAAQSGPRSSFNFSKKMRAKLWFLIANASGSFSNSSIHYIFPTVTGYNAGQPSHKSFGFTVSGTTIKGFAHNGTNYNTTTNSVTYNNLYAYLGVVENDGAGVYSFYVNDNGTFTSLGTVSGPTGLVTQEFLFGANASSTTTNDVNGYYIIQTVDFASEL